MRYILVKSSFEKLLEVAEKLKHKMPIAENDLRRKQQQDPTYENNIEVVLKRNLEENCFYDLYARIRFSDRFQPKEIKHYYYEADATIHDDDYNDHNDENEYDNGGNYLSEVMRKKSGTSSRKYFTAPYQTQLKKKFVFKIFLLHRQKKSI
jgi:hypothetical protein